jgi:hypothetical protein
MNILFALMILMVLGKLQGINVSSDDRGALLLPRNAGTNKARMVEYLNATVKMLIKRQLDSKINLQLIP